MRTTICNTNFWSEAYVPLPNAATRREILHKVLDKLLIGASCVGIAAIFLFFFSIYL